MKLSKWTERHFSTLARNPNPTARVGRPSRAESIEIEIFQDILEKVDLPSRRNVLDIGSGCGTFARLLIENGLQTGNTFTFVDSADVIDSLRSEYLRMSDSNFITIKGYFPDIASSLDQKFDCIIAYSVLHYVRNPWKFMTEAIELLQSDGVLLIGDIPNSDKKTRYKLKDNSQNEVSRRGKVDFTRQFSDRELLKYLRKIRKLGCNAYLLPQKKEFPHSGSREDLLALKNMASK
jgi:cyclopropane fatty-acyl-phospholipid synthase-like methyltransferase